MMDNQEIFLYIITLTALECLIYTNTSIYMQIDTQYVQVRTIRTYTYILYLACFQPMPLIYEQIHAYTYIYQRIHTYTYIYMKIRMLNDKVWIVGRCQCPAVTRTRCRPAPDTDWDCQWAARWPLTGHRSPAARVERPRSARRRLSLSLTVPPGRRRAATVRDGPAAVAPD